MLSISAIGDSAGAVQYFCEQREIDYYCDDGTDRGKWVGFGSQALGLTGEVTPSQLSVVFRGANPTTGEALVVAPRGIHRAGWDCTFSAPKAVSILQALSNAEDAQRLLKAHHESVRAALSLLEREAFVARRGKAGGRLERAAGLVGAMFTHHLSRNLDPQLHTHCLIANIAPRFDGSTGAIESKSLFQWKMAAGAAYRAELSCRLRALGLGIQPEPNGFGIVGLPKAAEVALSTRRQEIEIALSVAGRSSARSAEVASLRTRQQKINPEGLDLDRKWDGQLATAGLGREGLLASVAEANKEAMPTRASLRCRNAREILTELTAQRSVFKAEDLVRSLAAEALVRGEGLTWISHRHQEIVESMDVVQMVDRRGVRCFSTPEMRALEQDIISGVQARARQRRHAIDPRLLKKSTLGLELTSEQFRAVEHCCIGGDVALVNGIAGSGKSVLTGVVRKAYLSAGYRVIGVALSGKAAQSLQEGSGISSQTLHSLLGELDRGDLRLSPTIIVVLDEAAMVGSRLMARLDRHVARAGSKLLLVGDARQLQPIEAGGIYNALLHRMEHVSLTQIRRQREIWAAKAVIDMAEGRAERALADFGERGHLVMEKTAIELQHRLIDDWFHARSAVDRHTSETLILAATRADVASLNRRARDVLRMRGALSEADQLSASGMPWASNDRILFGRNSRLLGVRNGDLGTVRTVRQETDGLHLVVDLDKGGVVRFGPDYPEINHGYAVTVHKAQGSTVEQAFVLVNEQMLDREWAYVALSRARQQTKIYCPADLEMDLARVMNRSRQKDVSLDYAIDRAEDLQWEIA